MKSYAATATSTSTSVGLAKVRHARRAALPETRWNLAKTNYAFAKRQRDLAKQKKKEEKKQRKAAGTSDNPPEEAPPQPPGDETPQA
jgi:hypothetical protein